MFEEAEFGKPISEKLSVILRRNTTKDDYANVAALTNISFSTIRDVTYRTNSLTKSNSKAIKVLIQAAFENALATQLTATSDKIFLDQILRH